MIISPNRRPAISASPFSCQPRAGKVLFFCCARCGRHHVGEFHGGGAARGEDDSWTPCALTKWSPLTAEDHRQATCWSDWLGAAGGGRR